MGGSTRRQIDRQRFARAWTGYVPLVRTCSECGAENNHQHKFCAGCAANISDVEPTPSQNPNSGVRAMEERIRREAEVARRNRPFAPAQGTGLILTGVLLLVVAIWFPLATPLRLGVWLAGILATGAGLFRMRFDGDAIRHSGLLLAASTIGIMALVVTRGTPPTDPSNLLQTVEPTERAIALASPVAMPMASDFTGSVPTLLGDAGHSGLHPGPAPVQNPSLSWRFDTGSEILAAPIVADGTVFTTNRAGFLYAVDATSGQQLWRENVGAYVLRTTPTYVDGTLYLVTGFDAIALDAESGEERWRTTIRYAGTASPTISGDSMYIVSQEGWLYSLSTTDGSEQWKITTDGLSFGSPSISGERLVVGTDSGRVIGVNVATGRSTWQREFDSSIYTTPTIIGDTVWVVTADGLLRGLSLEDGGERFTLDTTSDLTVTASGETVFAPSADGGIYAIHAETDEVLWFASAGGPVEAGPVRTDSQVIISGGNRIAGFDIETGEQQWYFLAGDAIEAPPAVVSGHVFFGARDGVLYAVSADS